MKKIKSKRGKYQTKQIKLKDTLTKKYKTLSLNDQLIVKFYSCGPTVYDYPHLGNWYAFLRWDLLVRTLRALGFKVVWILNITDVGHLVSDQDSGEDKLVLKARQQRQTAQAIASYYSRYFLKSLKKLNFQKPTHTPKASSNIAPQINLIKKLEQAGFTYQISDGIYYDTSKFKNYKALAQADLQGLKAGARVEFNPEKKNVSDFALWKFSPKQHQRDMEWNSPWGKGFPGWHLECSAMAYSYLGKTLDIHAGGIDHIPVHHTNEIAQSEAAYQSPLAKIWIHSNFITVEGKKMSKSLHNCYLLEDLSKRGYPLECLRLAVFNSRFFKATDFNFKLLDDAYKRLLRWQSLGDRLFQLQAKDVKLAKDIRQQLQITQEAVVTALADNLNSPKALEILDRLVQTLNLAVIPVNCWRALYGFLLKMDKIWGLKLAKAKDINSLQKQLLNQREGHKLKQDFAASDQIRERLAETGLKVIDTNFGPIWQRQ